MNQVSDSGMVEFMVEIDKNQQKDKKKGQNDDRYHIPPFAAWFMPERPNPDHALT